jgi:hypothetical protein
MKELQTEANSNHSPRTFPALFEFASIVMLAAAERGPIPFGLSIKTEPRPLSMAESPIL